MDKTDYQTKMLSLLNDCNKFRKLNTDPTEKREASLQRYLRVLRKSGVLTTDIYNRIRPTGSNPTQIYGLPKLHKTDIPLRPIISGIGSYSHNLAKYLTEILKPYAVSEHCVKDSFQFVDDLLSTRTIPYMCSFDIISLFTNIPVDETISICLDKMFKDTDDKVNNLSREQFRKLLCCCVKQNHFMYEDSVYDQVDGVSMGSPLGPVMANIFMSHFEHNALCDYTGNKPFMYKRYVDDTFLVFNDRYDCELFLEFFNHRHLNIKFTAEYEENDRLPFLDVLVTRNVDVEISTSMFQKTFSGLYMKDDSFVPVTFKYSLIYGLLTRAFRICSTQELFNHEVTVIKDLLLSNGFSINFINKHVKKFMNKKLNAMVQHTCLGPEKKQLYLTLPYCGNSSTKLHRQLVRILSKIAPWAKLNVIFKPCFRLSTLSNLKSGIPLQHRSNVVYKINCSQCEDFILA